MPPKGKKKATKADENPVKENDVVEEKDQEDNVAENIGSNEEGEDESSGSKSPNGEAHSDESDKKTETMEDDDEDDTVEKVKSKKGRRKKKELSEEKPTRASKRNLKSDDDDDIDAQKPAPKHSKSSFSSKSAGFACEKTTPDGKPANLKISAWNVAGLRAWVKKDGSLDYVIHQEQPDMMVLLETKCADNKLPPEVKIPDYQMYTVCSEKEGYCGVMLYSKVKPMSVQYGIGNKEFDNEGRCIIAEFKDFYLVCAYVPNAGQGLKTLPKRLKWNNEFLKLLKSLDEKKPVVLCGDLNVAHEPIDLANPKTNTKNAGFTKDERDDFTKLLNEGFVDSFRHLYPDRTGAYTFWSNRGGARSRNVGWRLDYFVLSKRLIPNLCDSLIRPQIMGSDHCPITLCLNV